MRKHVLRISECQRHLGGEAKARPTVPPKEFDGLVERLDSGCSKFAIHTKMGLKVFFFAHQTPVLYFVRDKMGNCWNIWRCLDRNDE